MEFRVLGPVEVEVGGEVVAVPAPRHRALLALLVVHVGEVLSTDRMIEELWGDDAPGSGANALRFHVSKLRSALGVDPSPIVTRGSGYVLEIDPESVDAFRFEQLIVSAVDEMGEDPDRAADMIDDALGLWRGAPYSGLGDPGFVDGEVRRLSELRARAAEVGFAADLARGNHEEIVGDLEAMLVEFPFRERLWAHLMVALYRSGRQADALRAFRRASRALGEGLGIEPSAELAGLEQRILLHDPTLDYMERRRSNLPSPASSFVGRESEIDELVGLCSRDRLVTISGVGGIGKTRLAIEVARRCLPGFVDGVFFIDLIEVPDPAVVARRFLSVLEIAERPDRPAVESLVEYLSGRRCLLVVDNCEHVVDGVADTLAVLVPVCPDVHLVATSRVRLGVAGEELWELGGLQTGQNGEADLGESEAARLFADRARFARRGFATTPGTEATVGAICRSLDGIPLAIELAAARIRVMTIGEINERLTDRFAFLGGARNTGPDRHRTLRSMIDWSYDLLTESDQQLFRLLGVFRGGFNLDALQAMCADPDMDAADAVERLVDASLVTVDATGPTTRYRLLETVREYATQRLEENGEISDGRNRHLVHYASLGEAAHRGMQHGFNEAPVTSEEHRFWIAAMGLDLANLRHALDWALEVGDLDDALTVATPLGFYLVIAVRFTEAIEILDSVLDRDACPTTPLRCESLCRRALCLANIGDDRAEAALDEADQAVRRLGLRVGYSSISGVRAQLAEIHGDIIGAIAHSEEALASAQANEEGSGIAYRCYGVAEQALLIGEIDRAVELAERLDAEGDDQPWLWLILRTSIAAYEQRHQEALDLARNAFTVSVDEWWEERAKRYSSYAHFNLGHLDEARTLAETREPLFRRFGPPDLLERTLILLSLIALRSGGTEHAKTRLHETINNALQRRDPLMLWTAFRAAADWLAETGDPDMAAVLLGHCAAVTERRRYAPQALNCTPLVTLETLADQHDPERLATLAAEGASTDTDELAAQVLLLLTP